MATPQDSTIAQPAAAPQPLRHIAMRMPRWVIGSAAVTVVSSLAALLCARLLSLGLGPPAQLSLGAILLAALAIGCGVASIVGRQVHAALVNRLDLLSQALESSANAYLIITANGAATYANATFERFFGPLDWAPIAALEARLVGGEGSAGDFKSLQHEVAEKGRARGRIGLARPGGTVAWFGVVAHRLTGRSGLSLWSFEDVTQQQSLDWEVRDERTKLADFLDHAPIGFYSVDRDGRFLFVNETLAEWLGATPGDLVDGGAKLGDFLASPAPSWAPPHAPFEGGGESRGEITLTSRQGVIHQALVTQSVIRSGGALRTRSVVRDLTPERDWQIALQQSRERFGRLFAQAPVGIALLDPAGDFVEANATLGAFLDSEPAQLTGRSLASFLPEGDRAALANKLAATMTGNPPTGPVELRLKNDKSASLAMSRDSEGGLILHFIDTTEQKKMEAQFIQSQKMQAVGQLAGGVAHDFNNLLTAMIGFCDLLLLRFKAGDPSFADIMQIKQNANRAANLVRQLLAFSRQQTLQPRVLDITDTLADLSHLLRRLIGENIELKVVHGRDLGLIKVDQGQLDQVIINLAVNARDAMPGGGTLSIRTSNVVNEAPMRHGDEIMPPGEYVRIEVADTGIGIRKENLQRIFEPFFSTKEIGSGTGLGLSTVYGIVKQTGGFVRVESEPGKGAIFSIFLPRHRGDEAQGTARTATDEAVLPRDLTGTGTVLLVEDEDPVRLFSSRALKNKGYRVIEADSAERALAILQEGEQKVDLIITDVVMPKMDGPTLIKEVRELHPDKRFKVIFISGYAEDNFRKRLGDEADIHFLPKPFSLKQLAGKVKEVMQDMGERPAA